MMHDMLADVFAAMKNAERIGKRSCTVSSSGMVREILKIMQKHKYVGNFELVEDGKSGKFRIELLGRINDCNVIRPRYEVQLKDFIRWEKRFLPSVNVGILFMTTSRGILDHMEAKKEKIGGALLGYVY